MLTVSKPTLVTAAVLKPVTRTQAKKHCEIPNDDTTHDDQIDLLIDTATAEFEADTDMALLSQTWRVYAMTWGECEALPLPHRPIQSISSVKYYDLSNVQQTLSSSVYSLDTPMRTLRLAYGQDWPQQIDDRWDAIQVNYIAGWATVAEVPKTAVQAILLLIGYYFGQNRGDNDRANDKRAYESLIAKHWRPTYP